MLFTSYAHLNAVAERLAGTVPYPLLMQGEAPKPLLLDMFRRTPNAVLLATASFWQGVDVVGEQLSCVIIDKLPFASPSDPVVSARIDRLRHRGGNPFSDYQVPVAILMLKQGLGRLIRSATDRGILAVLDSRLVEKPYGRRFLASLPPAGTTSRTSGGGVTPAARRAEHGGAGEGFGGSARPSRTDWDGRASPEMTTLGRRRRGRRLRVHAQGEHAGRDHEQRAASDSRSGHCPQKSQSSSAANTTAL